MGKQRSTKEYIELLIGKGLPIVPLEPYINANTKSLHKCTVCDNEWNAYPKNILNNVGCPSCYNLRRTVRQKIVRKPLPSLLDQECRYLEALDIIRPGFVLVGDFLGRKIKTEHKCENGHSWNIEPCYVLLKGTYLRNCPHCTISNQVDTVVYYVKLKHVEHSFYKIGITSREVSARLKDYINKGYCLEIIHQWKFSTRRLAYDYEKFLLSSLGLDFINPEHSFVSDGVTECFYTYKAPIYPLTSNQEKG